MKNLLRWIGFGYIFYVAVCIAWFTCSSGFLYTFSQPTVGTLYSEWGNRRFMFMFFTVLVLIFPYVTFRELLHKPHALPYNTWRFWLHLTLSLVCLLMIFVFLIFNAIDWSNANVSALDNARNPFNDPRWCCVANNIAESAGLCSNTIPCVPGVTQAELVTNANAVAMIVLLNFVPLLLFIANVTFTLAMYRQVVFGKKDVSSTDMRQTPLLPGLRRLKQ